jgi:hypothetical protein
LRRPGLSIYEVEYMNDDDDDDDEEEEELSRCIEMISACRKYRI